MKRVDLRHLKTDFLDELQNDLSRLSSTEVCIYIFEIGEFDNIEKSIDLVLKSGCELMNSLKFNQADWTIVVKRK